MGTVSTAKKVQAVQNILYLKNSTKENTLLCSHGNSGYINVPQCCTHITYLVYSDAVLFSLCVCVCLIFDQILM
jgi:hypothetical protein